MAVLFLRRFRSLACTTQLDISAPLNYSLPNTPFQIMASQALVIKLTLAGFLPIQFQFSAIPNPRSPMILHLPIARDVYKVI